MAYVPDGSVAAFVLDSLGGEHEINIQTGVTRTPSAGTNNPVQTVNKGTINRRQPPGPGVAQFTYSPTPGTIAEEILEEAFADYDIASVVVRKGRTHEEAKGASGVTVAVAPDAGKLTGTVTGSGTKFKTGPFEPGMGLEVDDQLLNIVKINSETELVATRYGAIADGVATKDAMRRAPEADNATVSWRLVETQEREVYRGRVTAAGGFNAAPGGTSATASMDLSSEPTRTLILPPSA